MARRALLAALALCVGLPALAQQPVYPSYPPPPSASGENAPHTAAPDQSGQQDYPDQQQQTRPVPQKPSPYPPTQEPNQEPSQEQAPPGQSSEQSPDQYGQPSGQPSGQAQPPYPQSEPYPQQSTPAYPPSGNSLGWIPQGMEALGRTAAFHTDFTFDRSMLQLASGIWEGPSDPALADAISRLDGISVHSYHYAAPGMYDRRLLESVRRQYTRMGWQHLVTAHSAASGGATDLWISFHHMRATGAVVLFESPTNLNLIAFSGNLSPLDLLHLRGHFGIPPFPGSRFVPAPGPAARVAPPPRY